MTIDPIINETLKEFLPIATLGLTALFGTSFTLASIEIGLKRRRETRDFLIEIKHYDSSLLGDNYPTILNSKTLWNEYKKDLNFPQNESNIGWFFDPKYAAGLYLKTLNK